VTGVQTCALPISGQFESLGYDWVGETIVANKNFSGGLIAFPLAGGPTRQIVTPDPKTERAIVWPEVLPGGETVIATVWNAGSWDTAKIVAYSIEDGSSKVLIEGGFFGRYSPTGHLLFLRGDNLMAAPFDAKSLRAGNPVPVVHGVAHGTADGEAQFAVSPSGHLVYVRGGASKPSDQLLLIDRNGKSTPLVPTVRRYGSVDLSPDGHTAVVTIEESTYDVWQLDLERDSLTRVSHGGDDADALWTPDGNRVIWTSSRNGAYDLFWRAADNSAAEEPLYVSTQNKGSHSITPDGRHLLFTERGKGADIWMLSLDTRKAQPLIATDFNEGFPAVSPDGRWLAWASNESGRIEVYITSFPKPAGKWQVSIDGGVAPRWMPDGRELVFYDDTKWYLVPIEISPRPRAGKPRLIFEGDYDEDYCITRDGRIAIVKEGPRETAGAMEVVLNWGEELKRRVP
jgi:DNA-binding beta-propeller fold protein YncE